MAKRKGSSVPSCSRARKKVDRDAREAESTHQRLDKLPQEVWGKILDQLDDNDLFPLALSCRYFRQKQKELVARTRQQGRESGKRRLALKTSLRSSVGLWNESFTGQPVSVDYFRFCSKAEVPKHYVLARAACITRPAAYHGHLPLLQELIKPLNELPYYITEAASESSFPQSLLIFCFGF